jgi:chloramphenicol 3-O phosphotransferase
VATGHVVVLNGTSSSGKTTLAHRLHDLADELWVVIGQDDFTKSLLPHYVRTGEAGTAARPEGFLFARDPDGRVHVEIGPTGRRVLAGYRRAVAALARSGTNVVVAEAKFDPSGWEVWSEALNDLRSLWVGVRCSLEECERRENERGDRVKGLAAGHYELVHLGTTYGMKVDLTNSQVDEAARQILATLAISRTNDTGLPPA